MPLSQYSSNIASSVTKRPASAVAEIKTKAGARLLYVDNIRVFLTVLVLLFHMMIIYAGTGSWLYTEGRQDEITSIIGAWFIAVTQAYFMGLFLFISAYFVPGSYDRKGAGRFIKDRLIRLGIPLVIYSWIIDPLLGYLLKVWLKGPRMLAWTDIFGHFRDGSFIGSGPLWFVETLLIFSLVYTLWRSYNRERQNQTVGESPFPSSSSIAILALLLGVAGFLIRLWLPIGYNFKPLNLQFPFFAQYIALFILGLFAYRRNWLTRLPEKQGRTWLVIAIVLILFFPVLAIAGGSPEPFAGGWHWQALAYALWESFLCLGMCTGLIYIFRRYANRQGGLARYLSPNAYTAYLIHGPVITVLALAARDVALYPLLKWGIVSLVAVPLCFLLSSLIRKIPYTDRVL